MFLSKYPEYLKTSKLAIFSEMILHSDNLSFLNNFKKNSAFYKSFKKININYNLKKKDLYNGYGNDEKIF